MPRRKYVLHEYATERARPKSSRFSGRSKPKDKSLKSRAKVRKIYIDKFIIEKEKKLYIVNRFSIWGQIHLSILLIFTLTSHPHRPPHPQEEGVDKCICPL
jgi:hypothetical protein